MSRYPMPSLGSCAQRRAAAGDHMHRSAWPGTSARFVSPMLLLACLHSSRFVALHTSCSPVTVKPVKATASTTQLPPMPLLLHAGGPLGRGRHWMSCAHQCCWPACMLARSDQQLLLCTAGGPLGSGRQWMSWIHREDLVALIMDALTSKGYRGVYNATAPKPVSSGCSTCPALTSLLSHAFPLAAWDAAGSGMVQRAAAVPCAVRVLRAPALLRMGQALAQG